MYQVLKRVSKKKKEKYARERIKLNRDDGIKIGASQVNVFIACHFKCLYHSQMTIL